MKRCDGLWTGEDGCQCPNPIAQVCVCKRCLIEDENERFYCCGEIKHEVTATARHMRVRGREAAWASPEILFSILETWNPRE